MSRKKEKRIKRIQVFLSQHPNTEWGPAHVVLSDYNVDDWIIKNAIKNIDKFEQSNYTVTQTEDDLKSTREFLTQLLERKPINE